MRIVNVHFLVQRNFSTCKPPTGTATYIQKIDFEVTAIAHRIVHGGKNFRQSVLITPDILQEIEKISHLAPLHNPANVLGIREAQNIFPNLPHIGIFDTAFHAQLPSRSKIMPFQRIWHKNTTFKNMVFMVPVTIGLVKEPHRK